MLKAVLIPLPNIMFWSDQLVADIEKYFPGKKKFIVRDEKTPSGRVHVGSLRGVVIHAIIAQALCEKGYDAEFHYEINDADPMDGLPHNISQEFKKYMGKPLKDVPPPDENGYPNEQAFQKDPNNNYANYFGNDFIDVIHSLGFKPIFYKNSDLYAQGKYDKWIDIVLEKPEEIRNVYKEVSGSEKEEEWNPLQIVCEKCGKVGTTTVRGSSGERGSKIVEYECIPNKVKWATGCGYKGKVAPYKGRGKLPWKVEWAVKWQVVGVDIEGAGKDHSAAGGSHEVAERIVTEVLEQPLPFYFPYEFFTFGGAKMSSSKGLGASAKEVADTLPPELLRFLMVRTWPHQSIDFDPSGQTMPRLYDRHDEAAEAYFGRSKLENVNVEDLAKAYHFSQPNPKKIQDHFFPRFSRVAFIQQIPSLNFLDEVEKLKGASLTELDKKEALERQEYAKIWLERYADEQAKFEVQEQMPEKAKMLSEDQKEFLRQVAELLKQKAWAGEELHAAIHDLRKKSPLEAKEAFAAIYVALLGKDSGPQAGWFLEALDQKFIIQRFEEVARLPKYVKPEIKDLVTEYVIINKEVREKFPGIKLGFNVVKNAKISKTIPDLKELRVQLWQGLDFENLKKNSPRLEGFNQIYRDFGVNPLKNKPSPIALMTRVAKGKELPNINAAVDIYNLISIKHQLAIGLFNLDKIKLPIELRFARGGEQFQGLGSQKSEPIKAGELCYFDANGIVMARDFNHLDSELTKVDENTTNILINVDGNQSCSLQDIEACVDELEKLLQKYCGGNLGKRVMAEAKS